MSVERKGKGCLVEGLKVGRIIAEMALVYGISQINGGLGGLLLGAFLAGHVIPLIRAVDKHYERFGEF